MQVCAGKQCDGMLWRHRFHNDCICSFQLQSRHIYVARCIMVACNGLKTGQRARWHRFLRSPTFLLTAPRKFSTILLISLTKGGPDCRPKASKMDTESMPEKLLTAGRNVDKMSTKWRTNADQIRIRFRPKCKSYQNWVYFCCSTLLLFHGWRSVSWYQRKQIGTTCLDAKIRGKRDSKEPKETEVERKDKAK